MRQKKLITRYKLKNVKESVLNRPPLVARKIKLASIESVYTSFKELLYISGGIRKAIRNPSPGSNSTAYKFPPKKVRK